jgi:7-cyano-7-deazaguanine synthase
MSTAVLLSGGLDSAVLVADEAARAPAGEIVQPIYVAVGLAWEMAERGIVTRLLASDPLRGRVHPLVTLTVDMLDVYAATHWAVAGHPPGYHTADEEVYLPGRNIVLLGKAGVYCAAAQVDRLVLGTLAHNPFPDATAEFRLAMQRALSLGLGRAIEIEAPYANLSKVEVIRRGVGLGVPFELTLSCMSPGTDDGEGVGDPRRLGLPERRVAPVPVHCGRCSKCRERHDAFREAGAADPTAYADTAYIS